jgi:hypothetical protein
MHPKYWKRNVLREEANDGTTGSAGGALNVYEAAQSFPGLSDAVDEAAKPVDTQAAPANETPEAAAERLATAEAQAAEDAAKQPEGEQGGEPAKFTIKVDGKDVELTADEMAEHYKNGLRQKDYTQKTMAAAEESKAAAAEKEKAKAERDNYAQKLQHFAIQANGELNSLAAGLTEELLNSDPVEYLRQERIFKERQAQLSQAQQELQQIGLEQKQEHEQAVKSYQAQQLEALQAKLPEWKDPAKAKAEADQIKAYLKGEDIGFNDAELGSLGDHRMVLMARKAMQYDALMAKAKSAVKKVESAPAKVEKPGNGVAPTDGRTRAMKQFAESGGSIRGAADVFSQFLNGTTYTP